MERQLSRSFLSAAETCLNKQKVVGDAAQRNVAVHGKITALGDGEVVLLHSKVLHSSSCLQSPCGIQWLYTMIGRFIPIKKLHLNKRGGTKRSENGTSENLTSAIKYYSLLLSLSADDEESQG